MTLSRQVHLCSAAMIGIGADPISSFEQGTVEADVCAIKYPLIRDGLLSLYPWNFAMGQRRLTPTTEPPTADFEYRFELPGEAMRVLSVGSEDRGRGETMRRVGRRRFDCNVDSVIVSYTALPDETQFEAYFDLALIARLEAAFALPIAHDRAAMAELDKVARAVLQDAKTADAQQSSPMAIEGFALIDVR